MVTVTDHRDWHDSDSVNLRRFSLTRPREVPSRAAAAGPVTVLGQSRTRTVTRRRPAHGPVTRDSAGVSRSSASSQAVVTLWGFNLNFKFRVPGQHRTAGVTVTARVTVADQPGPPGRWDHSPPGGPRLATPSLHWPARCDCLFTIRPRGFIAYS